MPKLVSHGLSLQDFETLKKEGLTVEEPEKSPFNHIARSIYRNPWPYLCFMPMLSIIFIAVGFSNAQIEDSVSELWARQDSAYYHDLEYKDKVKKSTGSGGGGNSGALCIAKPRKGRNIMTTENLNQIAARMNETENIKVYHDGEMYTFDDVCYNPLGEYTYPCFRLTTMDCFEQGGYNFDSTAAAAWRTLFINAALETAIATAEAAAVDEAVAVSFCPSLCNTSKLDWTTDTTCSSCYEGFQTDSHAAQYDTIYYVGVKTSMGDTSYPDAVADAFMDTYLAPTVNASIATFQEETTQKAIVQTYCLSPTTYCDVTTSDYLDDSTCQACYNPYYNGMTNAQKSSTYYSAMSVELGGVTDTDTIDAYVKTTVYTTVHDIADDTVVHKAIAGGFCQSDSGDVPFCDMNALDWETNTNCTECFDGFLNGTVAEQYDYILYTAVRSSLDSGVAAGVLTFEESVTYEAIAASACTSQCDVTTDDYLTDATCYSCYYPTYSAMSTSTRNSTYYAAMFATLSTLSTAVVDAYSLAYVQEQAYGIAKDAYSLTNAEIDDYTESAATSTLESMVEGLTPYTFQIYSDPMGQPRTSTDNDDEVLLGAASEICYNWDEGLVLPEAFPVMTLGGTSPRDAEDVNSTNPYNRIRALQSIYYFLHPDKIQSRVASEDRPQGAKTISKGKAEEILYKFKKEFEKTYSSGWNDDKDGDVQFVGFTDDTGVIGSFGRTLSTFTVQSLPLSLLCYVITAVVCSLLLANLHDYVRSRMALGMFGSIAAVVAFSGALGLTCIFNIKLNIVQTWTLPFLMVGLGMDDMFILALAADVFFAKEENKRNGRHNMNSAEEIFIEAYENVAIPVSLTSVVNAAMFSIMTLSDIAAVKLTAVTAVLSVIMLYFTMMTCFAAAIALDFQRQIDNRNDIFCCFENYEMAMTKAEEKKHMKKVEQEEKEGQTLPELKHLFWDRGYAPMMRSTIGRIVILLIALVLFILACVGMSQMEVGLGLEEFFPAGSLGNRFAVLQRRFFPTWPAQMNWGEIDYYNPDIQIRIMKQFEDVVEGKRITDLDTSYLWTASLAEWSMTEDYDVGYCNSGNVLSGGNCGPSLNSKCTGSWVENYHDLKLSGDGGVCRTGTELNAVNSSFDTTKEYCPVLDLPESDYAHCLGLYRNYTSLYSVLSPGIAIDDDGFTPQLPIKFSKASGSSLFTYDLTSTAAYVDMISEARKACDNNGPHCWVSGIAFEYWEQYVDIQLWLLEISGYGLLIALFVSSLFFYIGFSTHREERGKGSKVCGLDQQDLMLSTICGFIVTLNSALSLYVVVGMSSLSGVNMCGLSAMACLMSAGFSVEFSVHVVHRFVEADPSLSPVERVVQGIESLFMPTALGFISSAVGIMTLLFSRFSFVLVYFFIPLFIMLVVTFFFGIFMLPTILSLLDLPIFKIYGKAEEDKKPTEEKGIDDEKEGIELTHTPANPLQDTNKTVTVTAEL
jgi:hypothetical protein